MNFLEIETLIVIGFLIGMLGFMVGVYGTFSNRIRMIVENQQFALMKIGINNLTKDAEFLPKEEEERITKVSEKEALFDTISIFIAWVLPAIIFQRITLESPLVLLLGIATAGSILTLVIGKSLKKIQLDLARNTRREFLSWYRQMPIEIMDGTKISDEALQKIKQRNDAIQHEVNKALFRVKILVGSLFVLLIVPTIHGFLSK